MNTSSIVGLTLLTLVTAASTSAQSGDWTTRVGVPESPESVDSNFFAPVFMTQFAHASADGIEVLGTRTARLSPSGEVLTVGTEDLSPSRVAGFRHIARAPDGSLYAWSDQREIAALTDSGTIRWLHFAGGVNASAPLLTDSSLLYFKPTVVDGNCPSGCWDLSLREVRRDGSVVRDEPLQLSSRLGLPGLEPLQNTQLRSMPGSDDLVVAANANFDYSVVARTSRRGGVAWALQVPGALRDFADESAVAVEPDGSTLLATWQGAESSWLLTRLSSAGAVTSQVVLPTEAGYTGSRVFLRSGGTVFHFSFAQGGAGVLVGRNRQGQQLWRLPVGQTCQAQCYIAVTDSGDLWVSGFGEGGYRLERYGADGAVHFRKTLAELEPDAFEAFVLGPIDGARMLLGIRQQHAHGPPALRRDEVVVVERDGTPGWRVVMPAPQDVYVPHPFLLAAPEPGAATLVVPHADGETDSMFALDALGQISASATLRPRDDFGAIVDVARCGQRLCVGHASGVRVYEAGGLGGLAWEFALPHRLLAIHGFASGRVLVSLRAPHPEFADIEVFSVLLLDDEGSAQELPPALSGQAYVIGFDPQYGALLAGDDEAFHLDGDGLFDPANVDLPDALLEPPSPESNAAALRRHLLPDGDLLVALVFRASLDIYSYHQLSTLRVARVAPDGAIRWTRELVEEGGHHSELAFRDVAIASNVSGQVLLSGLHRASNRQVWIALDGDSGEVLTRRSEPCPGTTCSASRMRLDQAGGVLGLAQATIGSAPVVDVFRIGGLFEGAALPVQPALSGVWYEPTSSGQGITAQFDAGSGVLALTWFTFSRQPSNEPEAQRWYTMTGQVHPDEHEALLDVYAVEGGVFDSPPAVAASRVGIARLRLASCDRMELRLQFASDYSIGPDARVGGEVIATLQRLLPAHENCTDSTGHQIPAALPPDPRLTGVWYEPATSGQGLYLYALDQPGQSSLVTGAWFTHDPAGTGGDPRSAHWFTVTGSGTADNATLEIYQTFGGHVGGTRTRNTTPIGELELRSEGCDGLEATYRFEDLPEAGAFRLRSGTLPFRRLAGSCDN